MNNSDTKETSIIPNEEGGTPVIVQFLRIKQEYPNCLLFFRMGDFYELFFDDAIKASSALDIALTKRGKHQGNDIPMCGVPFHAHESYLAKLIRRGFKVAVCEQLENPAEAKKRGSKAVVNRDVVRLVTSGTLTEDTLLDARRNNYLAALVEGVKGFALAWVDVSTGDFFTESIDSKISLAASLSRLAPSELLLCDNLCSNRTFSNILEDYREILSPLPSSRFNANNASSRLKSIFETDAIDAFGNFSKDEITASGVLVDYIEVTQKGKLPRLSTPCRISSGAVMEIDAATRRNLELSSNLAENSKGLNLLSVMDKTVTGAGARLLARHISEPLVKPENINHRLDMVDFFYNNNEKRNQTRNILTKCPDIERALSRISLNRGGPRDLSAVRDALSKIPLIKNVILESNSSDLTKTVPEALNVAIKNLGYHYDLVNLLSKALAEELPLLARDGGFIAKGYSEALDELKMLRDDSRKLIARLEANYISETGVSTLKIRHNNVIGYYIEVPAKQAQKLLDTREAQNGETVFLHRQTLVNNMRFSTLELSGLEDKIRAAAEKSLALENELFATLVNEIITRSTTIAEAANALATIDVAASLGELAVNMNYARPIVDNSLAFEIIGGRHPVVETALMHENQATFVANNCSLENNEKLWLLTGPNMAGKSTFLRQNALIAIMAQIGSFVPASSAHIGAINRLFSRVGASDDLARGRSTFMVEMVETAAILNQADERSFVILDEIGRGTATFDGLSIAWAVVEHLHDVNKCRALFATHYHELTNLSGRLTNLSLNTMRVKEWKGNIVFLHEIAKGTADRSYGIHVAKLAGLPKEVLKRASEVLSLLESNEFGGVTATAANILPLFASATLREAKDNLHEDNEEKENSLIETALNQIDPDKMSPKQALDELYKLKQLLEKND